MLFEKFQDGCHCGHLGYQNGMISAILTLYVTPMRLIKFGLNQTYSMGGDVVWPPSLISLWNDFSNSKSPCGTNALHQVWAQSDLGFGCR